MDERCERALYWTFALTVTILVALGLCLVAAAFYGNMTMSVLPPTPPVP